MRVMRLLLLSLLAAHGYLFTQAGLDRLQRDAEIRELPDTVARRAAAWNLTAEMPREVAAFERALEDPRLRAARALIVQTPSGSNVFVSIARHVQYPQLAVLVRNPRLMPSLGARIGAPWAVVYRPPADWRLVPLAQD